MCRTRTVAIVAGLGSLAIALAAGPAIAQSGPSPASTAPDFAAGLVSPTPESGGLFSWIWQYLFSGSTTGEKGETLAGEAALGVPLSAGGGLGDDPSGPWPRQPHPATAGGGLGDDPSGPWPRQPPPNMAGGGLGDDPSGPWPER